MKKARTPSEKRSLDIVLISSIQLRSRETHQPGTWLTVGPARRGGVSISRRRAGLLLRTGYAIRANRKLIENTILENVHAIELATHQIRVLTKILKGFPK